jgi:hypothetical protein
MRIPVFVSAPTYLNDEQEAARTAIVGRLKKLGLEARALGRREYPTDYPLKEIAVIARHCSGGVILGFEQFRSTSGVRNLGTAREKLTSETVSFPTPWNNLEAGILFGLRLPLLIFKEPTISGGVFDNGVTDVFVHSMPSSEVSKKDPELREVLLKWSAKVREHYYRFE